MRHRSHRHWCIRETRQQSPQQGDETAVISARLYQEGKKAKAEPKDKWQGGSDKCKRFPFPSVLSSPIFPRQFSHYGFSLCLRTPHFPAFEDHFFPRPPSQSLDFIYLDRASLCDRRLTDVSSQTSLRMGCPSASLPIGDRGPAPHHLRCRRNVSQCSVPTNTILYLHSLLFNVG